MSTLRLLSLVAAVWTVVECQSSTNPSGSPFFSPSLVRELTLNTTVSSVLVNTTDYTEYYWFSIPSTVGGIYYSLTNTESCGSSIQMVIEAVNAFPDAMTSLSCYPFGHEGDYCDSYDTYVIVPEGYQNTLYFDPGPSFRPDQHHYLSVYRYNENPVTCPYTLTVYATTSCPGQDILYGPTTTCVTATSVANGQTVSGNFTSYSKVNYYKMTPPQNVTRIWALVSANADNLGLFVSGGFAAFGSSYADDYTYSSISYNSTTGLYYYFLEEALVTGNYPWYFSIGTEESLFAYNMTFGWSDCGPSSAGVGVIDFGSVSSGNGLKFTIPDCSDPVVYNNIVLPSNSYAFNLPAYNSSTDVDYAAVYGYIYIPVGTTGALNVSCNSTSQTTDTFIGMSKGTLADCNLLNGGFYCYVNSYYTLLSQDLYVGGYWSVMVCSSSSNPETVTLLVDGSVTIPASPSPSPGLASPSPDTDSNASAVISVMWACILLFVIIVV